MKVGTKWKGIESRQNDEEVLELAAKEIRKHQPHLTPGAGLCEGISTIPQIVDLWSAERGKNGFRDSLDVEEEDAG